MTSPSFVYSTLHPAMYHGHHRRPPYFEGWYFKLVNADETRKYAIIPGVILGENGHAFVQVLDGIRAHVDYHSYPLAEFTASRKEFDLRIGSSRFTLDGFSLDLSTPAGTASGQIAIHSPRPWPVTWLSPGIMGWYAWVPAMECYHGVLSFDHAITGRLEINGERIDFDGGRGYIEKDWGQAFPEGYVWMQTNHFERPGVCLTASVAVIPWLHTAFPGFIVGLWLEGRLYRFATYTGAKLESIEISDEHVFWSVSDRHYRLEMIASRAEAGLLKGPTKLDMGKRVSETLNASVQVRLSERRGGIVFEGTGRHAGLEVFDHQNLLKMVG